MEEVANDLTVRVVADFVQWTECKLFVLISLRLGHIGALIPCYHCWVTSSKFNSVRAFAVFPCIMSGVFRGEFYEGSVVRVRVNGVARCNVVVPMGSTVNALVAGFRLFVGGLFF